MDGVLWCLLRTACAETFATMFVSCMSCAREESTVFAMLDVDLGLLFMDKMDE